MIKFDPGLKIGQELSNDEMRTCFSCSTQGGMRRSIKNQALVIVSDHTKKLYDDQWMNGILYYTGMGLVGDQILKGNQNKTLFESTHNHVSVHLFEVFKKKKYVYRGRVELADNPFQTDQMDKDGNNRLVWIFPVKPVGEIIHVVKNVSVEKANNIEDEELLEALKNVTKTEYPSSFTYLKRPRQKKSAITINKIEVQKRERTISLNALAFAHYLCEIDPDHETFKRKKVDINYTEPHHLVPMEFSDQFEVSLDVEENIVSLCSHCHNLIHYGADYKKLLKDLYERRKTLLNRVGIDITFSVLEQMYE